MFYRLAILLLLACCMAGCGVPTAAQPLATAATVTSMPDASSATMPPAPTAQPAPTVQPPSTAEPTVVPSQVPTSATALAATIAASPAPMPADPFAVEWTERPRDVQFSPDGELLAVSAGARVSLFETAKFGLLRSFDVDDPGEYGRASLDFSPDGVLLAIGSARRVTLIDMRSFSVTRVLETSTVPSADWISKIAFSPDSRALAVAAFDSETQLWSVETGEKLWSLPQAGSMVFSPDSMLLAVSSGRPDAQTPNVIVILDVATGNCVQQIVRDRDDGSAQLAFSADATRLLAASSGDNFSAFDVWNVADGSQIMQRGSIDSYVAGVKRLPNMPGYVIGFSGGVPVELLDESGQTMRTLEGYGSVVAVTGDLVFVEEHDQHSTVTVWNMATGELLARVDSGPALGRAFAASPDGARLAIATQQLLIWEHATNMLRPIAEPETR